MDASAFLPARRTLPELREAAMSCRGCPLYARATQTVFGEGPRRAELMVIGEQPGDAEDHEGRPFVGPAGALLDQLLEAAGVERRLVYVTNAVKHFKWKPRGKRRMHDKPVYREVMACKPWLLAEIEATDPRAIVCMGSTASFRITANFLRVLAAPDARPVVVTYHPSAVLRMPTHEDRARGRSAIVDALALARATADAQHRPRRGAHASP
jgi:DNA polymerase